MNFQAHIFPGDARRKRLDEIQKRIDAARAERDALESRPRPIGECCKLLAQTLGKHSSLAYRARGVLMARDRSAMNEFNLASPLTLSDLEWLLGRDTLLDHMQASLAAESEQLPEAIAENEYASRLAEIDQRLCKLYEEEEREVLRLFDAGIKAVRRENADPAVIYGIWDGGETAGCEMAGAE